MSCSRAVISAPPLLFAIETPSFLARLFLLSWVAYFRTLFDAEFAAGVARLELHQLSS